MASKQRLLASSLFVAATAAFGAAHAQPSSQGAALEEVVVTAQRREERLQDVSIAVTAVSAEAARKQGVRTTEDIQVVTPALNVTRVVNVPLFFLRGVGTQNNGAGEEPSVSLYIDGVYYSSGPGASFALNNIERIEVLRGPQGTLFGRNATGGVMNIITRNPSHDTQGEASVGYGNYQQVEGNFYGTTGLGDNVAADLALYYTDRGKGFGRNLFTDHQVGLEHAFAARTKLLWEPATGTRVTLAADVSKSKNDFGQVRQPGPGGIGADGITTHPASYQDASVTYDPLARSKVWGVSGRLEQEFGFARLLNIAAYRDSKSFYQVDSDGTPLPLQVVNQDEFTRTFTEELQLQSVGEGPLSWTVGAFFLHAKAGVDPTYVTGSVFGPAVFSRRVGILKTKSYAGFIQGAYEFTPATKLTLGGRLTRDEKSLDGRVDSGLAAGPRIRSSIDSTRFTYRAALDHNFTPDVMAYVTASRGYKSGSYNTISPANPPIRPETLNALETGLKSEWLDNRVRLNLSAYRYRYNNIQLSQLVPTTASGGGILILNAARAKIWGLEAEFEARLTETFSLRGGAAYTHGRYSEFPNAPASFRRPYDCATGLPTGPLFGTVTCPTGRDASGNKLIRTPDWTFNVAANYETYLGEGKLNANVSYYYNGGYFFEPDNRLRQNAYGLVNGEVRWTAPSDALYLRLWARNLLDKQYYNGASSSSYDQFSPGQPRTYGAAIGYKF